jgi:Undecaprenyl-phosphate galactose phosphotransferase WbaP
MLLSLIVSDAISLSCAVMMAVAWKEVAMGGVDIEPYVRLWPFLPAFLLLFCSAGLYSGLALSPPEELRRATLCSSVGFVLLSILTVSLRGASNFIRPALLIAICLSLVLVPFLRACTRTILGKKDWWGYPALLFGPYEKSRAMVEALQKNPGLGLKLVGIASDSDEEIVDQIAGVPLLKGAELSSVISLQSGMYAVVMPDVGRATNSLLQREGARFSHILAISDILPFESNMWVSPRAIGGFLGLEMKRRLLQPQHLAVKRLLDLSLAIAFSLLIFPLIAMIAICIRLGSDGPVLYHHWRIGRHGKRFRAYKFRTMLANSDALLERYLSLNPQLREEWFRDQKLKRDPRVTTIGRFLRKTSLDELPQLWNVLKGEMSIVGPRPIVDSEIERYGSSFSLYASVPGGVTGLWQVSGRNDTSYQERISFDEYYVRNWSVWLDLHILCRTVSTVLLRKGAY